MKIFSKDGIEMMNVTTIERQDEILVVKGKMMGSMATILHVTPRTLWEAFELLSWRTRFALPWLLLKGRKAPRN